MLGICAEKTREAFDARRMSLVILVIGVACACLAILRPLLPAITCAVILPMLWLVALVSSEFLVPPTDNALRPLLISSTTRVPFIIVMLGVIGGIASVGLVGISVGPIILSIGLAVWRNWAAG
jgi:predicted PurR-regulated permease PerM